MSGQRARSAVTADHRSVVPHIPGVPSWGAVLIAITGAAIGFAFDAGSGAKELTAVFSGAYVLGCLAAVLAVRHSGVFTAVIQPPLILFASVPAAYFLFHGSSITGVKDLLINCGYPLIERFPLMFFTTAGALLIGMGRWYHGMTIRRGAPRDHAHDDDGRSSVMSKITSMLTRDPEDDDLDEAPAARRRQHSIDRPAKTAKPAAAAARSRGGRPVRRTEPARSRHSRPPETEIIDPVAERPRRPRARQAEPPPPEPRRRPRPPSTREPRKQPPPSDRRSPYQRPERRSRFDDFEPFEPHGESGSNGANGTHHPVSRVRYRSADDSDRRPDYGTPPRASRQAEAWEYDI